MQILSFLSQTPDAAESAPINTPLVAEGSTTDGTELAGQEPVLEFADLVAGTETEARYFLDPEQEIPMLHAEGEDETDLGTSQEDALSASPVDELTEAVKGAEDSVAIRSEGEKTPKAPEIPVDGDGPMHGIPLQVSQERPETNQKAGAGASPGKSISAHSALAEATVTVTMRPDSARTQGPIAFSGARESTSSPEGLDAARSIATRQEVRVSKTGESGTLHSKESTQKAASQPANVPIEQGAGQTLGTDRRQRAISVAESKSVPGKNSEPPLTQSAPPPMEPMKPTKVRSVPRSNHLLATALPGTTSGSLLINDDAQPLLTEIDSILETQGVSQARSGGAAPLHQILARPEMPAHVARQLADVVRANPGRPVEIALSPAELGRVQMSMTAEDGAITVHILAERHETLDLMRRNIERLGEEFQSFGYEQISFSFGEGREGSNDGDTRNDSKSTTKLEIDLSSSPDEPITPLQTAHRGIDIRV